MARTSSTSHNLRPLLVTFSGIDGAGKTTQIEALITWLREAGFRVKVLRFWDDIAVLSRLREAMSHALFKSEPGVGTPNKPVERRDKNIQTWYMSATRFFLYFGDAARLAFRLTTTSTRDCDVIVLDRYLYDELANLDVRQMVFRTYARCLLKCMPRPDFAFLLDADPAQARARKPEYPISFLERNRASYIAMSGLADGMIIIPPLPVDDVTVTILRKVSARLSVPTSSVRPSAVAAGPTSK